ncbi:hypothetical protein SAMN05518801_10732 [Novosphingobium sp. CF614]|uniref:hypothetical protein n=1 Tax=Novosphingobium sp. CF614 TaxID=1884364 RepID=UPI0008E20C86|nr:hypothetical protein [Novosphingobium sp. CF614]SFG08380.1 hypothetical protein SAMN05518801_10732 [Novosphingobium sp. CF614]
MAADLTMLEKHALELSAELWNAFMALPVQHVDDIAEFRHKLHDLQRIVLSRPAHRTMQE